MLTLCEALALLGPFQRGEIVMSSKVAIVVPSANPTVEPEMRRLLAPQLDYYVARLPTNEDLSLAERNAAYLGQYGSTLNGFGRLALSGGFIALTGASYGLGPEGDRALCAALSKARSCPVATASLAINEALGALGVKRLGLISPYPAWLTEASVGYWEAAGFAIARLKSVSEEFRAYELTDEEVFAIEAGFAKDGCDAVLMTGTGARTIRTLEERSSEVPFLSSNLCGAWWLARTAGVPAPEAVKRLAPALFAA